MLEDRRTAFCARLKAARQRKGVLLEDIAAATKISRALLNGLEANNLSRWPQGLYRRAYLRDYLRAIDLPEESTVAEFVRLFPDEESPPVGGAGSLETEDPSLLSMTLDECATERFARARIRLAAAAIDVGAVCVLSAAAWWGLHAGVWICGSVVAVAYYSIGTAALGRSAGSWCLEDRRWRRPATPPSPASRTEPLFAQLREIKGLPEQPHPSMMRRLASVAFNAAFFRILFFR